MSRKQKVLKELMSAADYGKDDGWVSGAWLCHPSIGGSEGLRRVRELRADGHEIEVRTIEGRATREYRLVPLGQLFPTEGVN